MRPNRVVVAVALLVPLLAIAVAVTSGGSVVRGAPAMSSSALAARLREPLTDYTSAVPMWQRGEATDRAFAAVLNRSGPALTAIRAALDGPGTLLDASVGAYEVAVSLHRAALAADGEQRDELDRAARRVRTLGDRVFDRARERDSAPLDPGPGVVLHRPATIPEWRSLGLAPGRLLTAVDPTTTAQPPEAPTTPARQTAAAWRAAVADLQAPDGLDDLDPGASADALVVAADALRDLPTPDGDSWLPGRLGAAWLLLAEAGRVEQLARIVEPGADAELRDAVAALVALAAAVEP